MSKMLHVSWMNPAQSTDHYPEAIEGIEIEDRIVKPTGEYFILPTAEEAQRLKKKLEAVIPRKSYTVLDEDNKPTGHVVSEPEIAILNI